PDRANYRRFRIKTVEGQDDFASVAEVVRRRYTRLLNESGVQSPSSFVKSTSEDVKSKDQSPQTPQSPSPQDAVQLPGSSESQQQATQHAPQRRDITQHEPGSPVPRELQPLINDVSAAAKGRRINPSLGDAAAADVKAGRAPGEAPRRTGPGLP